VNDLELVRGDVRTDEVIFDVDMLGPGVMAGVACNGYCTFIVASNQNWTRSSGNL
jgi:hypothetical protein